jgi:DNA-binding NarL/FixJ family response regulator
MNSDRIKVAVIEGLRTARQALASIIDLSDDYQCVAACESVEVALHLLPRHAPAVILTDFQPTSRSGAESVVELKRSMPDVLVIMVTDFEDSDRIFSALRAGASGYLLKRSGPEELLRALREVRRGGVPMSRAVTRKVVQYFRDQSSASDELETLTAREKEVLEMVSLGFCNKEIAARLEISSDTVRFHLKRIFPKLQVRSRTEAALKFRGVEV